MMIVLAWLNCNGWWDLVFSVWSSNKMTKLEWCLPCSLIHKGFLFQKSKTKWVGPHSSTIRDHLQRTCSTRSYSE
jgi:hypothetical protein